MNTVMLLSDDQLKSKIKEAMLEVISELFPYPSQSKAVDEFLTRNQAATFLNITPNTITKYVQEGKLKAGGTDRKYMFLKSDLIKFMFSR